MREHSNVIFPITVEIYIFSASECLAPMLYCVMGAMLYRFHTMKLKVLYVSSVHFRLLSESLRGV